MKHYYQPTAFSCVQTAAAILLSHFSIEKTPEDILREVSVRSWPGKDEPAGTPNQDIATYIMRLGFRVEIISADMWVTDLSWQGKDSEFIRGRLEEASGTLANNLIGREGTELYIQAYLDFLKAGGSVSVRSAITSELLRELLQDGPVMVSVAYGTLHGAGKSTNTGETQETVEDDDIHGNSPNHNVVIDKYEDGKFVFYDPWRKPGIHTVSTDQMVAAIATAQQECDNMVIVVRKA